MKIITFTKHNPNVKGRPEEDSFRYSKKSNEIIIAVADGITRDLVKGKYPDPSPAKIAADLFCESFLKKSSLRYVNDQIKRLNNEENPMKDYLENDFWACVAVGGVIKDYKLSYEFIADCGLAVFNKEGKLKFKTANEGPNSKGSIDEEVKKKYSTGFNKPKGRKIIRSKYRNNLDEPLAYGALTGEKNAEHYVGGGEIDLEEEDYVLFYTDGMIPLIFSDKFDISSRFNSLEDYFDQNLERIDGAKGTLVAVRL